MTTVALDESLNADLEAMKAAGTLKSFRHITGPMRELQEEEQPMTMDSKSVPAQARRTSSPWRSV